MNYRASPLLGIGLAAIALMERHTFGVAGMARAYNAAQDYQPRKPRPPRYANDPKHRKAVDGRRANLLRIRLSKGGAA